MADLDIGTLSGSIELEDNFSSALTDAEQAAERFASGVADAAKSAQVDLDALNTTATQIPETLERINQQGIQFGDQLGESVKTAVAQFELLTTGALQTPEALAMGQAKAEEFGATVGTMLKNAVADFEQLAETAAKTPDGLVDASALVQRFEQDLSNTVNAAVADFNALAESAGQIPDETKKIGDAARDTKPDLDGMGDSIKKLNENLDDSGSRAEDWARTISSAIKGVAIVTAGALATATASVIGYGASIVALAEKGSKLIGVRDAFNRLAEAIGQTGEALLGGLEEGTRRTVDSMDLMEMSNRALSAGLKVTGKDMRDMGAFAREMAKAAGTDAAQELGTLFNALTTGRTRTLAMKGVTVDLQKAEKDFAAQLGTTADKLNQRGRIEAGRIAILEAVRQKVNQLGESELTFAERFKQVRIAIGNWWDDLAIAIAQSPALNKALDSIGDTIESVFGAKGKGAIDAIVGALENFADIITNYVVPTVSRIITVITSFWDWAVKINKEFGITDKIIVGVRFALDFLGRAFNFVRDAAKAVMGAWREMPDWLKEIAGKAVITGAAMTAVGVALSAASDTWGSFISSLDTGINIITNLGASLTMAVNVMKQYALSTYAARTAQVAFNAVMFLLGPGIDVISGAFKRLTIVETANTLVTTALAKAKVFFQSVVLAMSVNIGVLASRFGLLTAAEVVNEAITNALAKAKVFLQGVIIAMQLNFAALIARVAGLTAVETLNTGVTALLTRAKMTLNATILATQLNLSVLAARYTMVGGAAGVLTAATTRLTAALGTFAGIAGTVLSTIAVISVIAIPAGAAIHAMASNWDVFTRRVREAGGGVKGFFQVLTEKTKEEDLDWLSRATQRFLGLGAAAERAASGIDEIAAAQKRLDDRMTGKDIAEEIIQLQKSLQNALAGAKTIGGMPTEGTLGLPATLKRIGEEALRLREAGGQLSPELAKLADEAEKNRKQFSGLDTNLKDFTKTLRTAQGVAVSLRDSQRELLTTARGWAEFAGKDITALSVKQQEEYLGVLQQVVDKYGSLEKAGMDAYQPTYEALDRLVGQAAQFNGNATANEVKKINDMILRLGDVSELSQEALLKLGAQIDALRAAGGEMTPQMQEVLDLYNSLPDSPVGQAIAESAKNVSDAVTKEYERQAESQKKHIDIAYRLNRESELAEAKLVMTGTEFRKKQNEMRLEDELATLDSTSAGYEEAAAAMIRAAKLRGEAEEVSRRKLEVAAAVARRNYEQMAAAVDEYTGRALYSGDQIRDAWNEWRAAEARANSDQLLAWANHLAMLDTVADGIARIGSMFSGMAQTFISGIGGIISGWVQAARAVKLYSEQLGGATAAQKAQAIMGAAVGVIGATGQGSTGQRVGGGALSGIMGGLQIGAAFGPLGMAAGAIIGGIGGAITGLFRGMFGSAGRDAVREFEKSFGSSSELHKQLNLLGKKGEELWINLTQKVGRNDQKAAEKAIEDIKKAFEELNDAAQRYGLTLEDLKPPATIASEQLEQLAKDVMTLSGAGASLETLAKKMAGPLNDALLKALETGQKIPKSLQPVLETMIRTGQISEEVARKLLKLPPPNTTPWREMQDIAEEFGISLDALGPKFQGAKLIDGAKDLAEKFKILVTNGADVGAVLAGMGEKAQEFFLNAKKWGVELPATMKPLLEAMIKAGTLVDENGNKIEDLKDVKFGVDLTESVEDLIVALRELIDTMNGIPRRVEVDGVVKKPSFDEPGVSVDDGFVGEPGYRTYQDETESSFFARQSQTIILNMEGRKVAEVSAPYIPGATSRYKVG